MQEQAITRFTDQAKFRVETGMDRAVVSEVEKLRILRRITIGQI